MKQISGERLQDHWSSGLKSDYKFTSDFPLKSSNKLPKMQSKYNIFIPDLMTKTSQTDTPKICLKNVQTAFVSYDF